MEKTDLSSLVPWDKKGIKNLIAGAKNTARRNSQDYFDGFSQAMADIEINFGISQEGGRDLDDFKSWFKDGIEKILISTYMIAKEKVWENAEQQKGFNSALTSIAIAVGIKPEGLLERNGIKAK